VGISVASSASRSMSVISRTTGLMKDRILIVEEEKETCGILRDYLEDKGYEIATAGTCALAEEIWHSRRPDIALLDYSLPDGNALGLIPRLKAIDASIPILVLTGYGSIDLAVEAVKLGAELFLPKPADLSTLLTLIQRSLENQQNRRQQLAEKAGNRDANMDPFLGTSDAVRRLADLASKAALSDAPVLLQGEEGTGKRTIARWLHRNGPRASGPYVHVNCGEFPGDLLGTALFGDGGWAADEASESKAGALELAHKGTVLLDEIESVDIHIQPRLLKVVDEKVFCGHGEVSDRRLDIRLIAASEQLMGSPVLRKPSRDDLRYRINWIQLSVPPLRERVEDISALSAHILGELTGRIGASGLTLGGAALRAMQNYSWPGNVRELRNVLERVVLVTGRDFLADQDFHLDVQIEQYLSGIGQFRTLEEMERDYIQQVLRRERGRVQLAARKLGIPRSSLYHKLKQYKTDQSGLQSVS
jgi:DNA-binding NtrC family response regulator